MRKVYLNRKSFEKFDEGRYILYLNEETIPDYVPEAQGDEESAPCLAYIYDGAEIDGGTLILADSANYDSFVAGLVRLKYSQNQVEAILCNQGDGSDEHLEEFNALQMYRKECKQVAAEILARAS